MQNGQADESISQHVQRNDLPASEHLDEDPFDDEPTYEQDLNAISHPETSEALIHNDNIELVTTDPRRPIEHGKERSLMRFLRSPC